MGVPDTLGVDTFRQTMEYFVNNSKGQLRRRSLVNTNSEKQKTKKGTLQVSQSYFSQDFSKGAWLCEAALWLNWFHQGQLVTSSFGDLVELNSSRFQDLFKHEHALCFMREEARQILMSYAEVFLKTIDSDEALGSSLNLDIWGSKKEDVEDIV